MKQYFDNLNLYRCCAGIGVLLMLCSCEHYDSLGLEWIPGEIEVEGVELIVDKDFPKRMYGVLPRSGGTIMLSPERDMSILRCEVEDMDFKYNDTYLHYVYPDYHFDLPTADFQPALTLGGEWYGANEWMWVECLVNDNHEYRFVAYIDENTTSKSRIIDFHFTGCQRWREIIITQQSE